MSAVLKKQRITFLSDLAVFVLAAYVLATGWIFSAGCIVMDGVPWTVSFFICFLVAILTGLLVYVALTGANDWANVVTIAEEGIWEGPFFTKRKFHPYSDYPLVYCTSYVHGMIGSPDVGPKRMFIVLTDQRLSDAEKENINLVRSSRKLVKIKYSKKRYAMLMEILPQNLKAQLAAAFLVQIEPDNLARRRSAITSKARRRKKQKRHK